MQKLEIFLNFQTKQICFCFFVVYPIFEVIFSLELESKSRSRLKKMEDNVCQVPIPLWRQRGVLQPFFHLSIKIASNTFSIKKRSFENRLAYHRSHKLALFILFCRISQLIIICVSISLYKPRVSVNLKILAAEKFSEFSLNFRPSTYFQSSLSDIWW